MSPRTLAAAVLLALAPAAPAQVPPAFANTADPIPPGWTGPTFELSRDYPAAPPAGDPMPWKQFDFRTQPEQYARALFGYCREGNEGVDWAGQKNPVRKWYHAPGFAKPGDDTGREFIRGLTRERTSPAKELHPNQTDRWTNWAVGLYNPAGGYALGQVWRDPAAPVTAGVKFPDGAVAVKLLFTTAPVEQVPFLARSKEWQANVSQPAKEPGRQTPRSPQTVRLLQVDLAVRESKADDTIGWVFATLMYQHDAPGATEYDRLVPVGVAWGDDPDLTPARYAAGDRPKQSWINPASKAPHVGWLGRLNGPVDNPKSSCVSCHSRAGFPQTGDMVFRDNMTDEQKGAYFRNVKAGEPYAPGVKSFDYSLQLGMGVRNFPGPAPVAVAPAAAALAVADPHPAGFNPRAGQVEPTPTVEAGPETRPATPENTTPADQPAAPAPPADRKTLWIVGAAILAVVLLALIVIRMNRRPPAAPPPGR